MRHFRRADIDWPGIVLLSAMAGLGQIGADHFHAEKADIISKSTGYTGLSNLGHDFNKQLRDRQVHSLTDRGQQPCFIKNAGDQVLGTRLIAKAQPGTPHA